MKESCVGRGFDAPTSTRKYIYAVEILALVRQAPKVTQMNVLPNGGDLDFDSAVTTKSENRKEDT